MKRLLAIGFIWLACALAWVLLGSTLLVRSGSLSSDLTDEVHRLWGPPFGQEAPHATFDDAGNDASALPDASDVAVGLHLEQRQKGLLWFPTYAASFRGRYTIRNPTRERREMTVTFPISTQHVYDDFAIVDESGAPVSFSIADGGARWSRAYEPEQTQAFTITYRVRGTSRWEYVPARANGQVRNLHLAIDTDFQAVDFVPGSLSPTEHASRAGHWKGEWSFSNLVTTASIGIDLPQKTNPGPLASRVTFFAPVGLLFFFFVVSLMAAHHKKDMHPMNYFFFGCAFFAFHLLFAYLIDHVAIGPAFAIASAVSVGLVVTYARHFTGWRFALREMGMAQALYLVLFSLTFLWTGFTGLTITVGAIVSLFVMMQLTARTNWTERFARPKPEPYPSTGFYR